MSTRARELAERFAQAHEEFTAFVEQIPEARWQQPVGAGDPRSLGTVAQHVAWGYTIEQQYIGAIVAGQPLRELSREELEALNAALAREWQDLEKAAVLTALQTTGTAATAWIRGLSDEELDRQGLYFAGFQPRTVEQWLEWPFLVHAGMHLTDLRAALER